MSRVFSLAYAYVMLMLVLISHAVVEKTVDNANINRVRRKIESSSSEAKIVGIGKERRTIFFKPTGKGDKWSILLCVGGENRAADPNFGSGLSKQLCPALSAIESCGNYLKHPPLPPPPPKKKK